MMCWARQGLLLSMLTAASPAAALEPDVIIEYSIHDQVASRGAAGMGAPAGVKGWDRRTLYISDDRSAEYTSGALPGLVGVAQMKKVYVETPSWKASFEPDSGVGLRWRFPAGHRRIPGGIFASSDAAETIHRTRVLEHLGPVVSRRTFAGHACNFYRPDPDFVKMELCIGNVGGRRVLLYQRLYEADTVWLEEAQRIEVGIAVPASKFTVPETVQDAGLAP